MTLHSPQALFGAALVATVAVAALGSRGPGSAGPAGPPASGLPGTASADPGVALSDRCAICHANAPGARAMRDADGEGLAPHDLWRASVHSASAVDPIWRATLAAELAAAPDRAAETAETCLRCHAPMASVLGLDDHDTGDPLHALDCDGDLGAAARDGVSCTVCHGITPEGLGTEASFDGHFVLDGERRLYGPHPDPVGMPMRRHTGFTPVEGAHVRDSALCATCHTLTTPTLDAGGRPTGGHFLEQGPYLEWKASRFGSGPEVTSCQACHLPTRDAAGRELETRIARNPGGRDFPFIAPRAPFGRHEFLGGNTLLLGLMAEHAEALGAPGEAADYERARAATAAQLRSRTADLELVGERELDGALELRFEIRNRTGHKLPTGYPARRVFLTVEVLGPDGEILFASGRTDERGRLVDAEGRVLATELRGGPAAAHVDRVEHPGEVAQWRAEALDSEGAPTFRLLRMARWGVDDRLLPDGWNGEGEAGAATAPVGVGEDPDFGPGRDGVTVRVPLAGSTPPVRVRARLAYQPYSPRWLAELEATGTSEVARLTELLGDRALPTETLAELDRELAPAGR